MLLVHLPPPVRPSEISRFSVFWLGAATGLLLVCLLSGGQPYASTASTSPQEQHSPPAHVFPQTLLHAPEVGFISEVQASGPSLRAVMATWPIEAM